MTKPLAVAALLSLLGLPLLSTAPARAEEERCFTPEYLIAQARAERPSTAILARLSGAEAAALITAMNNLSSPNADDPEDADEATPAADEITVLRSAQPDEVLLIGAEAGCLVWRGEISRSDYEHATWKAFGLPV